jgi:electron transport complex protein RnfC
VLAKTFRGGVHPAGFKALTVDKKIRRIPIPSKVILPLTQNAGAPNKALVKAGDSVKKGQVLAKTEVFISAPVHSPVSGRIKAIQDAPNPVYGEKPAFIIESDVGDQSAEFTKRPGAESLPAKEILEIIRSAGVVGLGGAAFPTHVKLDIPQGKNPEALILNGAECEPYLTCDHRLMLEKSNEILKGALIAAKILGVSRIFVAIEENKLSAVFVMEKAAAQIMRKQYNTPAIKIALLKTKYPQGGEKQLIKALLAREIPPGKLPIDVGCVVQNVGTCLAIYEAVYEGMPLIERCVTFTGDCLKENGNFLVSLGTPFKYIIDHCGGFIKEPAKIIVGGPMMGITQYALEAPVIKGVTGVVFLSDAALPKAEETQCIRCAKCAEACPMNLMPTDIMRAVKYEKWERLEGLHPEDCFECGACAYMCPSKVQLVQHIKLAKRYVMKTKKAGKK